jgi:hypothetical protein
MVCLLLLGNWVLGWVFKIWVFFFFKRRDEVTSLLTEEQFFLNGFYALGLRGG